MLEDKIKGELNKEEKKITFKFIYSSFDLRPVISGGVYSDLKNFLDKAKERNQKQAERPCIWNTPKDFEGCEYVPPLITCTSNRDKTLESDSWLKKIRGITVKSILVASLLLSIGCGHKSYCCEKLDCDITSSYVCEDLSPDGLGNYCIKDKQGKNLECCTCTYHEPPEVYNTP